MPPGSRAALCGPRSSGGWNFVPIAEELGCTPSRLAIAWCLLNPNVSTVILGASRVEQLEENLQAAALVPELTPDIQQRLAAI